jgi:hypothetical protein
MINQLQLGIKTLPFNKHNLFANVHITEGDNVFKHTSSKEITLNQYFCICDHIETQRYISTYGRTLNTKANKLVESSK